MGWIENKSIGLVLPGFTDEFVDRKTAEGLQPFGEVVGGEKVNQVGTELCVAVVVVALNGGFLDGAVHALDLSVGPRMIGLSQAMVDALPKTDPIKRVTTKTGGRALTVLGQVGELNAVVGQHGVDAIKGRRPPAIPGKRTPLACLPVRPTPRR